MKKAGQAIVVMVLIALIGYFVWYDWLRPSPEPPEVNHIPQPLAQEEVVGIGAALKGDADTGLVRIIDVVPNSPAAKAGLSGGLLIQKVNDTPIEGMALPRCVELIRGRVGTKVRLVVWNSDTDVTNTVELTRARLVLNPAPGDF